MCRNSFSFKTSFSLKSTELQRDQNISSSRLHAGLMHLTDQHSTQQLCWFCLYTASVWNKMCRNTARLFLHFFERSHWFHTLSARWAAARSQDVNTGEREERRASITTTTTTHFLWVLFQLQVFYQFQQIPGFYSVRCAAWIHPRWFVLIILQNPSSKTKSVSWTFL